MRAHAALLTFVAQNIFFVSWIYHGNHTVNLALYIWNHIWKMQCTLRSRVNDLFSHKTQCTNSFTGIHHWIIKCEVPSILWFHDYLRIVRPSIRPSDRLLPNDRLSVRLTVWDKCCVHNCNLVLGICPNPGIAMSKAWKLDYVFEPESVAMRRRHIPDVLRRVPCGSFLTERLCVCFSIMMLCYQHRLFLDGQSALC